MALFGFSLPSFSLPSFSSVAKAVSGISNTVTRSLGGALSSVGGSYGAAQKAVGGAVSYVTSAAADTAQRVVKAGVDTKSLIDSVPVIPVPTVKFPTLPKVTVPSVSLPKIDVPVVKFPELPKVSVPSVSLPKVGDVVPKMSLPAVALPVGAGLAIAGAAVSAASSLPRVSLPTIALPDAPKLPDLGKSVGGAVGVVGGALSSVSLVTQATSTAGKVFTDTDTGLKNIVGTGITPTSEGRTLIDTAVEARDTSYEVGLTNLIAGETGAQKASGLVQTGATFAVDAMLPMDLANVSNKWLTGRGGDISGEEAFWAGIDAVTLAAGALTGGLAYPLARGLVKGGKILKTGGNVIKVSTIGKVASAVSSAKKVPSSVGSSLRRTVQKSVKNVQNVRKTVQAPTIKAPSPQPVKYQAPVYKSPEPVVLKNEPPTVKFPDAPAVKSSPVVKSSPDSVPLTAALPAGKTVDAFGAVKGIDEVATVTKPLDNLSALGGAKISDDAIAVTRAESRLSGAGTALGYTALGAGVGALALTGLGLLSTPAGISGGELPYPQEDITNQGLLDQLVEYLNGLFGGETPLDPYYPDYPYVPLPDGGYIVDPSVIPPDQEIPDDWYIDPQYPGGDILQPAEFAAQDTCEYLEGLPVVGDLFEEAKRRGIALPVVIGAVLLIAGLAYFFLRTKKGKEIVQKVKGAVS